VNMDLVFQQAHKLVSLTAAVERVAGWRHKGERIVFANGCFDLLHVGHVRLLDWARREGSRLVVGLNSDASVRALKGPGRPIIPEADRARILAALSSVDLVVVFDEQTPLRLINALRPDVLVKGSDYRVDQVVGAKEVQSWGGRVALAPLVQGCSTSGLLREIGGSVGRPRPPKKLLKRRR
jgi:D-beta-D-heptose 7-phosphate kinase/D-beta-D-heptose 1-phosphate adenosyltransferase